MSFQPPACAPRGARVRAGHAGEAQDGDSAAVKLTGEPVQPVATRVSLRYARRSMTHCRAIDSLEAAEEMNIIPKTRLEVHFGEIRSDLAQLDTVLDDAVAMLFAAFTNVAGLVRLEQKLAAQLALAHEAKNSVIALEDDEARQLAPYLDTPVSLLLAQHAVLADQIETQISAAVRSLQFQDMCSQILSHTSNRLAALELAMGGAEAPAASAASRLVCESPGEPVARSTAEVIEFPRSRPVAQHGMQPGEVELF